MQRQKILHEFIELGTVAPPESLLDRLPVFFVELCLGGLVQTHQHEISNQIGLSQIHPGRVQAFKDHLRVILAARQTHVHDHQFLDAVVDGLHICLGDQITQEQEVLLHPFRGGLWQRLSIQKRNQRFVICPAQMQLVPSLSLAVPVAQVIVVQLIGRRFLLSLTEIARKLCHLVTKRDQQKRQGSKALLAVDQQPTSDGGCVVLGRDIDH